MDLSLLTPSAPSMHCSLAWTSSRQRQMSWWVESCICACVAKESQTFASTLLALTACKHACTLRCPQVLTTSNITEAIDLAFVDRADIKAYIGNPNLQARWVMGKQRIVWVGLGS